MENKLSGLYVAHIKREYKDKTYTSHLIRRSYRDGKKVKQKTIANISPLPETLREIISKSLKGEMFVLATEALEISRSRAHGHVAAIRKVYEDLDMDNLISNISSKERDLIKAMIISRVINAQTKLATTRSWHDSSLAEILNVEDADEDELYSAMDWLLKRQPEIEKKLAERHLKEGSLCLYDVSSSYYEGSCCSLASYGHNRDRKKGKAQITYGLMVDTQGRPVSVRVYEGNTPDTRTATDLLEKIKGDFGLKHFVFVGDRAMITYARANELKKHGIDFISALRASQVKKLVESGNLQLSLFDERDLAEIKSPDYANERLIVCKNPYLADERKKNRQELLKKSEEAFSSLALRVASGRLKEEAKIGQALGKVANKYKMAKHFIFEIGPSKFSYKKNQEKIEQEAALDGIYVIRTSVAASQLEATDVLLSYKRLSLAESAFRTLKGIDIKIRPIHHRLEERVRAHIFLCMLSYYLEWHLRRAWASMLFDDEHPGAHEKNSPVLPAIRSEGALKKVNTKRADDGSVVHSFKSLMSKLSSVVLNDVRIPAMPKIDSFRVITKPDITQKKAFDLIGLDIMKDLHP